MTEPAHDIEYDLDFPVEVPPGYAYDIRGEFLKVGNVVGGGPGLMLLLDHINDRGNWFVLCPRHHPRPYMAFFAPDAYYDICTEAEFLEEERQVAHS